MAYFLSLSAFARVPSLRVNGLAALCPDQLISVNIASSEGGSTWDSGETTDACGRIDFSPPTPTPKRRAFRGPRRGWRLPGHAPSLPARCFRYYHIYEYIGSLGGAKYLELRGVLWAEHRRYRACERVKVSYQNRLLHTRVRNDLIIMVIELWMASTYATSHARIMGNYLKKHLIYCIWISYLTDSHFNHVPSFMLKIIIINDNTIMILIIKNDKYSYW